jgi:Holliday junction resolvase RusA-like endonuclease
LGIEEGEKMITIYGNLYSSKNSKRIAFNRKTKKSFIIKSEASLGSEKHIQLQLQSLKSAWLKMVGKNPSYPLAVSFKIYRKTKQRFDYVNIVQQIFDLMVKAGYLPDDSANYLIPVFAPYSVDSKNPRVEIRIVVPVVQ